ncbi:hypothetical protein [Paenibacillus sp. AR247]|uniref:hypothetical protein n=1 Tax=Paenibacillus sp. AR247 TaxID=1631599 RepID=UPI000CF852FC|nr:hypothetical protein [Paenibacillus sp. AR247]PQP88896.1 hypothetical protein CPT76_11735 [Paenibacillus sp. AR247]
MEQFTHNKEGLIQPPIGPDRQMLNKVPQVTILFGASLGDYLSQAPGDGGLRLGTVGTSAFSSSSLWP